MKDAFIIAAWILLPAIGLVFLVEKESERECAMLGVEMGLPAKEHFGLPCMLKTKHGWEPARNMRTINDR